jgi:hypothetical protein
MHNFAKSSGLLRLIALVLTLGLTSASADVSAFSDAGRDDETTIVHNPVQTFVPGFRINVKAVVDGEHSVESVRCYFRAAGDTNFMFVEMPRTTANTYVTVLPAPSPTTVAIQYVLLAVNSRNVVVRSQMFAIERAQGSMPTEWQSTDRTGQLAVKTELAQAPATVNGFADSVMTDVEEATRRFGFVVGGLYAIRQAGPAGFTGAAVFATPPARR